ncbi:DNA topoisomerase I, mitochondrial isoform X1 [Polypterus senegalus]|uniref:DNA topoisomerase I, mitochondrial isoform X1 n=1 Tax=Polypterus senegalus TaxID=55291 RepID=UPI001964613B|nr:DNA topoisomerase I, mitochondrial isoform X1 [Polypterus senegalus]
MAPKSLSKKYSNQSKNKKTNVDDLDSIKVNPSDELFHINNEEVDVDFSNKKIKRLKRPREEDSFSDFSEIRLKHEAKKKKLEKNSKKQPKIKSLKKKKRSLSKIRTATNEESELASVLPIKKADVEENEQQWKCSPGMIYVKEEEEDMGFCTKNFEAKRSRKEEEYDDFVLKPKQKSQENMTDTMSKNLTSKGKNKGKKSKKEQRPLKKVKAEDDPTSGSKQKEEEECWRWWEEDKYEDGVKWKFLEHAGPFFPPAYEPLPKDVKFFYDGELVSLSLEAEEVAGFFAHMLNHEYTTKEIFRCNFFNDWRKVMTEDEKMKIVDLNKCDFTEMANYFTAKTEARKNCSKEEKQVLSESCHPTVTNKIKEVNQKITDQFGYCLMDHHREKIGNFRIEPPGLFRGRGEHPKQGKLKKRVQPEDVIINCSKDSKIPEPPFGHKWKEVRHDNTVTWLTSWTDNVQGSCKYIMLSANSKLKGQKDWEKYEVARKLKTCVDEIRANYRQDWKSKLMSVRQRAVALYFIDKLALRAGTEKEEGETADTVGCCSLRVEHIKLHPELDGKHNVVEFDFLGKDSIRYYNQVPVKKTVFKNLKLFMENKDGEDDLFDKLNTTLLNKHLQSLMPGLSAKVFRTYNASITLQEQLQALTDKSSSIPEKILAYNRANRAVAILCNHQRAPPKTFEQSMTNLNTKIASRKEQCAITKKELREAKKEAEATKDKKLQMIVEKKRKAYKRCKEGVMKLMVQATDRQENKQIALGTSKLNYLDPRISVAWCKNTEVPLEKIYNKSQKQKFAWAVDMTAPDFVF